MSVKFLDRIWFWGFEYHESLDNLYNIWAGYWLITKSVF